MMIVRFGAGLVALVLSAHATAAQQPGAPQSPDRRGAGMMDMAGHMRMMDSLNARLDTLVSRMNRAAGNRKVTAMADVINELVAQRKAMQEQMRQMMESRQGMMIHMMGDSAPAQGRPPTSKTDSAAADSAAHARHHPPN
jgi:TolA-binding protein